MTSLAQAGRAWSAELGRSDGFAAPGCMTGNLQCLHLGRGPSRAGSTPAATVASLFLQVWRVWFEGRDGIRSDWVGIREVFPAGPQTPWLFPWSQRGPSKQ